MFAQRVCRRDPIPRRRMESAEGDHSLPGGQESAPRERREADSGKESVRPKGGES
jgi:hypothetical protein